jgi:maltose-binding protein MalE
MGADVAGGQGTKHRIGEGMKQDIGITVAVEPAVVGNGDAAEDQGATRNQRMNVITHAHAQHGKIMSSEVG